MKKREPGELGDTHKRGINITLALLDEMLCQIEQWARGREVHSVLYQERNTLTAVQREMILHEIKAIRRTLCELAQTLRLEPNVNDGSRDIWGRCWGFLEHLEELHGKHMRRYGEPPAWLSGFLDPKADELIEHLQKIATIAGGADMKTD